MKKGIVALLAVIMLSSTAVYASDTPISDWINSKTSKITRKEKEASQKAAEREKKRQEKIRKQQKKQAEAKKKAEQRQAERKKQVEHKKKLWKELFTFD